MTYWIGSSFTSHENLPCTQAATIFPCEFVKCWQSGTLDYAISTLLTCAGVRRGMAIGLVVGKGLWRTSSSKNEHHRSTVRHPEADSCVRIPARP